MDKKVKTLLCVEDEVQLLNVLTEKFTKAGYRILQARDGKEGLEMALKEKPDMILLDILMPNMDGLEMLKKLRKDAWGQTAHVVLLTNLNEVETISEAVRGKIDGYLVKSDWNINDLVDKVNTTLDEAENKKEE